jgi:hypothetical protein
MLLHALLHYAGLTNASGAWYLFWSGIFGDATIFAGVTVLARKHNCHVKGCKSVLTSNDPEVHAPACRRHHSHRAKHGRDPLAAS